MNTITPGFANPNRSARSALRPFFHGLAGLALGLASAGAQENYSSWASAKPVVVNTKASGAGITSTIANVPVLVRLDSANAADVFAGAKAGGADLRFRRVPGPHLAYEIERWDASAKRAEIWVQLDSVKGNDSATTFYMYWGKPDAAAGSDGNTVFNPSFGFAGVWHLGNAAGLGARPNAITGRHAATPRNYTGEYVAPAGVIGKADSLGSGRNDEATRFLLIDSTEQSLASSHYTFPDGRFSYSAWINAATIDRFARFISLTSAFNTTGTGNDRVFFAVNSANPKQLIGRQSEGAGASQPTNSSGEAGQLTTGAWTHVAMTIARGDMDTTRLYKNGALIAETLHDLVHFPAVARGYVFIGKDFINIAADSGFNGKIDEARLSHVARSADWIRFEYESQKPGSAVVSLGPTGVPIALRSARAVAPQGFAVSPFGDGLSFRVTADAPRATLSLIALDGRTVWTRSFHDAAYKSFAWDGRATDGALVTSGRYVARLRLQDAAGGTLGVSDRSVALGF